MIFIAAHIENYLKTLIWNHMKNKVSPTEPAILTFMSPAENLNIIDTIISKHVQGLKQHYLIL